MARVTVEDCIDKVDNRFDLVLLAAHRARMISSGSQLTVDRDNDKNPVVSLREIADSSISPEDLREELVHSLQKFVEVDEPEPDTVPLDRLGRSQRRRRRHRGRGRAHDRGRTPEGPRGPGASGRAARRGRIGPTPTGRPDPLICQRPGHSSGPLLLLTFLRLGCVLGGWPEFGRTGYAAAWPWVRRWIGPGHAKLNACWPRTGVQLGSKTH